MDLEKKFALGESNRTYRRIDPEYKTNIYAGYNDDGKMSLVITEYGSETPVSSSKLITVSQKRREDGRLALSFDLMDASYKSLFLIFCRDIIITCEKNGPSMAVSSAVSRWKYWKEMFGKKASSILDKTSIKGLLGELIELRDHFMAEYGAETAVNSWMGPLLGHKDFEIFSTWYEVKSVSENAVQVTISSLEQLDSDMDGHLVVVRLEETSSVNTQAITLNSVVLSITNLIKDPEILDLFRVRLNNMGYEWDEEYDKYKYMYIGTERYIVNQVFPAITRERVPSAIGNVRYTIILSGISEFKEK